MYDRPISYVLGLTFTQNVEEQVIKSATMLQTSTTSHVQIQQDLPIAVATVPAALCTVPHNVLDTRAMLLPVFWVTLSNILGVAQLQHQLVERLSNLFQSKPFLLGC